MITHISVEGYKCLEKASVEVRLLNVLVGANACGKSSLLQTLLLLRQSADETGLVKQLDLTGPLYEAGTVLDILHPNAEHSVKIQLSVDDTKFTWRFSHDREREAAKTRIVKANDAAEIPASLFVGNAQFAYLGAERLGPRVSNPLPINSDMLAGTLDSQGQNTAAFLARAADGLQVKGWEELSKLICRAAAELDSENLESDFINTQGRLDLFSSAALNWILPGFSVSARIFEQADTAAIQFVRDQDGTKTDTRATHVGFGLSYTLPIVVASLALGIDSVILIENPEAHLHPKSQSRMGVFLALMAATGRQIFVETHSDHVLNGIRLAVAKQLLQPEMAIIDYFEIHRDRSTANITQLEIGARGELSAWPMGFFDQIENDLAKL